MAVRIETEYKEATAAERFYRAMWLLHPPAEDLDRESANSFWYRGVLTIADLPDALKKSQILQDLITRQINYLKAHPNRRWYQEGLFTLENHYGPKTDRMVNTFSVKPVSGDRMHSLIPQAANFQDVELGGNVQEIYNRLTRKLNKYL